MRDQSRKFKRDYKTEKFEGGKLNIETNNAVKFLFLCFPNHSRQLTTFCIQRQLITLIILNKY